MVHYDTLFLISILAGMIFKTLFTFIFLVLAISATVAQSAISSLSLTNASLLQSSSEISKTKFQDHLAIDTLPYSDGQLNDSISGKIIFLSDSLKSFKQLLGQFKGQTVLLDMWGTWCGPCRKEINNNSAALKEHFAGRDVKFLYVANYDIGKEKIWKELIAYFKLEGYHLLAGSSITNDIMKRIKSQEYPTYVIIDKYGNFEKSKAGYPMKRAVLIEQIEAALKK